jgi:hypothetical protein
VAETIHSGYASMKRYDPEFVKELHNWSRHFDVMLWAVTTVFVTGLTLLLAEVTNRYSLNLARFGIGMTCINFIFASSFRFYRRRIHDNLPEERASLLQRGHVLYWQWGPFLAVHLAFLWLYCNIILAKEKNGTAIQYSQFLVGFVGTLMVGYFALSFYEEQLLKQRRRPPKSPRGQF